MFGVVPIVHNEWVVGWGYSGIINLKLRRGSQIQTMRMMMIFIADSSCMATQFNGCWTSFFWYTLGRIAPAWISYYLPAEKDFNWYFVCRPPILLISRKQRRILSIQDSDSGGMVLAERSHMMRQQQPASRGRGGNANEYKSTLNVAFDDPFENKTSRRKWLLRWDISYWWAIFHLFNFFLLQTHPFSPCWQWRYIILYCTIDGEHEILTGREMN